MNKSDYDKYYKTGGTYIIPVEVFNELFDELEEKLQQKENIIKEVREYVENYNIGMPYDHFVMKESLLEILDKENE